MRRRSKRELRNRFDSGDEMLVRLDSLRRKGASVLADGVECDLNLPEEACWEVLRSARLRARVVRAPQSGPVLASGTRRNFWLGARASNPPRPLLEVVGCSRQDALRQYETFLCAHPVGSLVPARVIDRRSKDVLVELAAGIRARLMRGDRPRHARNQSPQLPARGESLDVIIRRFNLRSCEILVCRACHAEDDRYCAYASGYRSRYAPGRVGEASREGRRKARF